MRSLLINKMRQLRMLDISQEAISEDGKEREYVFFGQMVDEADLKKASRYEDQYQYRILAADTEKSHDLQIRIRKTVRWTESDGDAVAKDPVYWLTIKSFKKGDDGVEEVEFKVDADEGERIIDLFKCTDQGMAKRRYFFSTKKGYFEGEDEPSTVELKLDGDVVWEIDVPIKENGEMKDVGWVKLDLEMKSFDLKVTKNNFAIPFPIRLKDVIYQQPGRRDEKTEAKVKRIIKNLFRI